MKTMKELAQIALDSQNACNLSGIVHSFSSVITDLRAHLSAEPDFSTNKLNQHHICVLFTTQILWLSMGQTPAISNVWDEAYAWANAEVSK